MILPILISIVIGISTFTALSAQKTRVLYEIKSKADSTRKDIRNNIMLLDIYGNDISRFYAENLYKSDSVRTKGVKPKSFSINFNNAVIKNGENLKKYNRLLVDVYEVNEKTPVLAWKIIPEKKKIGNYECQKATLAYKGRQWTAWFTQDIPIPEGPFIFKGLPGLIIRIHDDRENYDFMVHQLLNHFYDPYDGVDFRNHTFVKVNKEQLNKIYISNYLDPYKEAKMGKIKMNFVDENGNEVKISTGMNWQRISNRK